MLFLKKYSVLYAEDEPIIRMNLEDFLLKRFNRVLLAIDGKEALEIFKKESPDVVILDIEMPYINGLEVAREIREVNKTLPIVILTAYSDTHRLIDAVELNLVTYLIKPIKRVHLNNMIEKVTIALNKISKNVIELYPDYYWYRDEKQLYYKKELLLLTTKELRLLRLFVEKFQQNVYYEDIMVSVWEEKFNEEVSMESIKSLVSSLRKKLPKNSIQNIYGRGYKFQ